MFVGETEAAKKSLHPAKFLGQLFFFQQRVNPAAPHPLYRTYRDCAHGATTPYSIFGASSISPPPSIKRFQVGETTISFTHTCAGDSATKRTTRPTSSIFSIRAWSSGDGGFGRAFCRGVTVSPGWTAQ